MGSEGARGEEIADRHDGIQSCSSSEDEYDTAGALSLSAAKHLTRLGKNARRA